MVNALLYPGHCIHRDSVFHQNVSNHHMPLLGHEMERSQAALQTEKVSAQQQCHQCSSTSRDSKSGLQPGQLTDSVLLACALLPEHQEAQGPGLPPCLLLPAGAFASSLERCTGTTYLVAQVAVGLFGEKQCHHVRMPLLGSQVQGSDPLHRLCVCRSPVLQQAAGHLHLVLLGSNVQGGVPILQGERLMAVLRPRRADQ